ncbi:hypothetical protein ASG60_13365 [Methylobacterium sp. Leaf469]|nr:hypothetical protein ASG60_13365 [Methylobacterium sp. Leaf469]
MRSGKAMSAASRASRTSFAPVKGRSAIRPSSAPVSRRAFATMVRSTPMASRRSHTRLVVADSPAACATAIIVAATSAAVTSRVARIALCMGSACHEAACDGGRSTMNGMAL